MVDSLKVLVAHRHFHEQDAARQVMVRRFRPLFITMGDGLSALQAGRVSAYDLLLCSVDLPVVTGFELVRALRIWSPNKTTPALLVGENLDHRHRHIASRLGRCVLVAPEPKEIENGLDELFGNARLTMMP